MKFSIGFFKLKQAIGLIPDLLWLPDSSKVFSDQRKSDQNKMDQLDLVRKKMQDSDRYPPFPGTTQLVFGVGNQEAQLMFVGEAPGRDEDLKGEPFVGRAGQLLTKIIEAMGLKRAEVYITNVVKSRPPENRTPTPEEMNTWLPLLLEQIEIIRPKVIICLGAVAASALLQQSKAISSLRGRFQSWPSKVLCEQLDLKIAPESIALMPTYHPAYLLRNPEMKRAVWEDMQQVMKLLGIH